MSKTYYKLVNSKLMSFNINSQATDISQEIEMGSVLQYKIDEWVSPKIIGSKIFIFDTLKNTRQFLYHCLTGAINDTKIFECKAKKISKEHLFINNGIVGRKDTLSYFNEINKLRKNKKRWTHIYGCSYSGVPKGTLFASSIMLTKDITFEK